jgi:hypothetical protein
MKTRDEVPKALQVEPWWRDTYAGNPEIWPLFEDFKVFLAIVWAHLGLPKPTPIQLDIADYLQTGPRRKGIMAFRGVGKSYITSAFVCWCLLRNPDEAIMVVSASKQRADDFSIFTKRLISEIEILQHLMSRPGQRDANVAFDVGPAKAKHSPSVKSVGITGQLTGSRATRIIADDIEVPGNSFTQGQRDKTNELVKEFDSVLMPGGEVIYLGTPQTEQSLYNRVSERGYEFRIWPSEVPDQVYLERMRHRLAPFVTEGIDQGRFRFGRSLDPRRFSDDDLRERRLSNGNSSYALQFLLDTSLADADRYPLKLKNLVVMSIDPKKGPASVAWGPKPASRLNDVVVPGLDGDGFYPPAFVDTVFQDYQGTVMFCDPAGRGSDETSWAIASALNGTVFVPRVVGTQGGYEDHVLRRIANDAKAYGVHLIRVEDNFGQGMFAALLKPHLRAAGHLCEVECVRAAGMKELRIIQTLEPIMDQHRLVIGENVVREDDQLVQGYRIEDQAKYRLFYQLTRITRDRGALAHDDRLDALAGAVSYWTEHMAIDAAKAAEKAKDIDRQGELKWHLANQIGAVDKPFSSVRKSRKDGLFTR